MKKIINCGDIICCTNFCFVFLQTSLYDNLAGCFPSDYRQTGFRDRIQHGGKLIVLERLLKSFRNAAPMERVVVVSNYTKVSHVFVFSQFIILDVHLVASNLDSLLKNGRKNDDDDGEFIIINVHLKASGNCSLLLKDTHFSFFLVVFTCCPYVGRIRVVAFQELNRLKD